MTIVPSLRHIILDSIIQTLAGLFSGWLELREAALAGERARITQAGRQALAEARKVEG